MSSAVLWIFLPLAVSILLWWLQSRERLCVGIASALAFSLAVFAQVLPIGDLISLGPLSLRISPSLVILGRSLTLERSDLPMLTLIYLVTGFWFLLSPIVGANRQFVPLGFSMVSLLVAALSVEPFLYAALFIEMAVIIGIPILVPPGKKVGQGILRYLIFLTLGMPFILFSGWMLTGVESGSGDPDQMARTWAMLGLGFGFLLAVFPFYTWIPLLSQDNSPYETGFILSLLPTMILVFALTFIDRYAWVRDSEVLYAGLRVVGVVMVLTSGVWAAFQSHLGRIFGYAVIQETGFLLLTAGIPSNQGLQLFFMLLLPRLLGLGVWSFGLAILSQKSKGLGFQIIQGYGRKLPWVTIGIIAANLSIAGMPILADFPVKQSILIEVAGFQGNLVQLALIGSIGLIIACLRSLRQLMQSTGDEPVEEKNGRETRSQKVVLFLMVLGLVLVGTAPQWLLSGMVRLLGAFQHLV